MGQPIDSHPERGGTPEYRRIAVADQKNLPSILEELSSEDLDTLRLDSLRQALLLTSSRMRKTQQDVRGVLAAFGGDPETLKAEAQAEREHAEKLDDAIRAEQLRRLNALGMEPVDVSNKHFSAQNNRENLQPLYEVLLPFDRSGRLARQIEEHQINAI